MDDLIPLTDFDKRVYPPVDEEDKTKFIVHSNQFERISLTEEQVHSSRMVLQGQLPAVKGQELCINLILNEAKNPDLIPKPENINKNVVKQFPWLFNLHYNLLLPFAIEGEKKYNDIDYPLKSELGQFRADEKKLGHRNMPPPHLIKPLLIDAFIEYSKVYHKFHDRISAPQSMEYSNWLTLEKAAYLLNLKICCIKPFKDGSNRVARLAENLLRLNVGLRFKIISDKDKLLRDIWSLQDSQYKFS